jgi:hypothetical protein
MWKKNIPLLFTSMVICLVLTLTSCSTKTHQLSTSVDPIGAGYINPSAGNFKSDVILFVTPAQNYKFDRWAGDASGTSNPLTVTMNSDKQIVAQFSKITTTPNIVPSARCRDGTYSYSQNRSGT